MCLGLITRQIELTCRTKGFSVVFLRIGGSKFHWLKRGTTAEQTQSSSLALPLWSPVICLHLVILLLLWAHLRYCSSCRNRVPQTHASGCPDNLPTSKSVSDWRIHWAGMSQRLCCCWAIKIQMRGRLLDTSHFRVTDLWKRWAATQDLGFS